MPANKTNMIWVGPADGANQKPLTVEGKAVDAFIPGQLVSLSAAGLATSAVASDATGRLLVAREVGEQFGADIFTAVTVDDNAIAISPRSGEFFYVAVAAAQTVLVDSPLASNGDGTVKVAAAGDVVIAYAQEASAGAAANTLILAYKE